MLIKIQNMVIAKSILRKTYLIFGPSHTSFKLEYPKFKKETLIRSIYLSTRLFYETKFNK